MPQQLGDLLVKKRVITPEQLQSALAEQKKSGIRLGSLLVKLGYLSNEDVTNFLSRQYGVPSVNLDYFDIDPAVVKLIPLEVARRYQMVPLSRVGASLTIAIADPSDVAALDNIKSITGFNVEPVVAYELAIAKAIEKAYGETHDDLVASTHAESATSTHEEEVTPSGESKFAVISLIVAAGLALVGLILLHGTVLGLGMSFGASILSYESYLLLRTYR